MNFHEMYTSFLFGTQAFPNVVQKATLRYKIGVSPLCFNASFDYHRFFFCKCDIIKDSVPYNVVCIALFSYENLDQLAPRTN